MLLRIHSHFSPFAPYLVIFQLLRLSRATYICRVPPRSRYRTLIRIASVHPSFIMSSIVNNIKDKVSGKNESSKQPQENEQTFSIQPHPAKTNDPRDLQPSLGGGLNTDPNVGAFHARDPYIPPPEIKNNMPPAMSREELRARAQELNKE
ncbi:hypothetical protein BD414DRAFT_501546 [Trametes punicea]|nr:hypothetical protein BD414DRAFT_501546 [Trametes punicea]